MGSFNTYSKVSIKLMYNMNKYFLVVIIGLIFLSCKEKERVIIIEKYQSGATKVEEVYKGDKRKKEGTYLIRSYYENGKLLSEVEVMDSLRNGLTVTYHENGQLKDRIFYEDGIVVDTLKRWYPNGQLKQKTFWVDGKIQGHHNEWYDDGNIWSSAILEEGNGTIEYFYKDKTTHWKGFMKDNLADSTFLYFYPNGVLEREGNFVLGKEEGEWKYYYDDGKLYKKNAFSKGELDGEYIVYDRDGKVIEKGKYKDGELLEMKKN